MKPAMAVVDWYGPYTLEEARNATSDFGDGIYMATGARKYQRIVQPQYLGIASSLSTRLRGEHHKLSQVTQAQELWLGEIATPRRSGRKIKVVDKMLDLAEWAHIYFCNSPSMNARRNNLQIIPLQCTTVGGARIMLLRIAAVHIGNGPTSSIFSIAITQRELFGSGAVRSYDPCLTSRTDVQFEMLTIQALASESGGNPKSLLLLPAFSEPSRTERPHSERLYPENHAVPVKVEGEPF